MLSRGVAHQTNSLEQDGADDGDTRGRRTVSDAIAIEGTVGADQVLAVNASGNQKRVEAGGIRTLDIGRLKEGSPIPSIRLLSVIPSISKQGS